MKATIEINEKKLKRVMKLAGIKTQREAIDFALSEAEKVARIRLVMQGDFFVDDNSPVIDVDYDLLKLRQLDRPVKAVRGSK